MCIPCFFQVPDVLTRCFQYWLTPGALPWSAPLQRVSRGTSDYPCRSFLRIWESCARLKLSSVIPTESFRQGIWSEATSMWTSRNQSNSGVSIRFVILPSSYLKGDRFNIIMGICILTSTLWLKSSRTYVRAREKMVHFAACN